MKRTVCGITLTALLTGWKWRLAMKSKQLQFLVAVVSLTCAEPTVVSTSASYVFTVSRDRNPVANFALMPCTTSVVGWGDNYYGETTTPAGLSNVVAIAAGDRHNLALKSDGTAVGWGSNADGQAATPAGLNNVVAIAAGWFHSLALKSDGTVVGWGNNYFDEVTPPADLSNVVAIAAGGYHSLALKSDGTVVGWGQNDYGVATPPAGLNNVVAVATGPHHGLALKSDGTVVGWGDDFYGEATPPAGLSGIVALAAGEWHSLALQSDGTVVGWGADWDWAHQAAPPAGLSDVVAIAAGSVHSLALQSDGTVVGWGYNAQGQATPPAGLGNVVALAAGGDHSLALTCAPGVDTAAPTSSVDAISPYWHNQLPFTISATTTDNASGVASVELFYRYSTNNVDWTDWTSFGVDTAAPWSWSFNAPQGSGHYEFYSIATDAAGNIEEPPAFIRRIYPSDDAFTDLRDAPEINYGNESWIGVNGAGGYRSPLGYDVPEGTFLKFDLSAIPSGATITRATFGAYAYQIWWSASCDAALRSFGTDWDEATITGNNAPWTTLGGNVSSIVSGSIPGWWVHAIDVPYVQGHLGGEIGFYYTYPGPAGGLHYGQMYYSKEYPDGSYHPYLELALGEAAAEAKCGVDTCPPNSTVDPIAPYRRTSVPFNVTATASDNLSGVTNVALWYRHSPDNLAWGAWTDLGSVISPPWSWSFTAPQGSGHYEFYSVATDAAGNVEEDWSRWQYRRPIAISNAGSVVLTNYQVLVTLDTASLIVANKLRSDAGDLRFALGDGTQLSYWIESGTNTASTKVWVKVPLVAVAGTTIYAYYGNPIATSASNGDATFVFFDDFANWNSGKWGSQPSFGAISNGILVLTCPSSYVNYDLYSVPTVGGLQTAMEFRQKAASSVIINFKTGYGETMANFTDLGVYRDTASNKIYAETRNEADIISTTVMPNDDDWHKYKLCRQSSASSTFYVDGTSVELNQYIPVPDLKAWFRVWKSAGSPNLQVDYLFTHRYVLPEPTAGVGAEEQPPVAEAVCEVVIDADGDGVPDDVDQCPDSPLGAIVNANGCSIAQLVPCAGPFSGGKWKNHGDYVSAVTKEANKFLAAGLITGAQKGAIVAEAAQSNCGK
jgi:hypothetical protein